MATSARPISRALVAEDNPGLCTAIARLAQRWSDDVVMAVQSPLELSAAKFGSVPRYYIECLKDVALAPEVQRQFYQRTPCRKIYPLEASHSPFFSMPQDLSKILCEIADNTD